MHYSRIFSELNDDDGDDDITVHINMSRKLMPVKYNTIKTYKVPYVARRISARKEYAVVIQVGRIPGNVPLPVGLLFQCINASMIFTQNFVSENFAVTPTATESLCCG